MNTYISDVPFLFHSYCLGTPMLKNGQIPPLVKKPRTLHNMVPLIATASIFQPQPPHTTQLLFQLLVIFLIPHM